MTSSRQFSTAAAITVILAVGIARADDATELERAKTSYDAGRYAEGADRFKDILSQDAPNALHDAIAIERARAYYAACLIALGRTRDADDQIEKLLRNNPLYTPDPVVFPGKVTDRFTEVKSRLRAELQEAARLHAEARSKAERDQRTYIATLQRLASQETVVTRHSRWLAALPFGVGQFQNGHEGLGYALLFTEGSLAVASIAAGAIHMQLVADFSHHPEQIDVPDLQSRLDTSQNISIIGTASLAAIAIAGIVQAQAAFVPEIRETRPRNIPPPPVIPTVSSVSKGAVFGLSGAF